MALQTEYFIASDGTKCTSEEIRTRYEVDLREKAEIAAELRYICDIRRRVTPKYARLFYEWWSRLSGYCNPFGRWKQRYNLDIAKERIMHAVVRVAKKNGWLIWRMSNVLYVETPYGQCSWHVGSLCDIPCDKLGKWFRSFPVRPDLQWSGVRNSDIVVRRVLGEVTAQKPLPELIPGEKYGVPEEDGRRGRRYLTFLRRETDSYVFEYRWTPRTREHVETVRRSNDFMRYVFRDEDANREWWKHFPWLNDNRA
jgi:hypothetical protein